MMGPSRGDTICGNVAIDALGPMHFGALVLGPIHIARTPTEPRIWLVTVERTLLPRSVDVSRFMAGVGELANATITGAVPIVLVDREADFCVVGYRALDGAKTLATVAEAGADREAAAALAGQLAETLAAIHAAGAVHGVVTPTTVVHDGRRWWTWEHGIVAHCSADRLGPRMKPLGGDVVAPELRTGNGLTPASDVFAWGAAVACVLTGASGADAVAMIQDDDDDGDPLRELVRAALEPIAELRPRDASVLCDRLRAIGVTIGAPASSAAPPGAGPSESAEFSFADLNEPTAEATTSTLRLEADEVAAQDIFDLDVPEVAPTPAAKTRAAPPPPPPPSADDVVELLDLDTDTSGDPEPDARPDPGPTPTAAASAPDSPSASGPTPPSVDGGPDTSERWRALAEQYLANEISDEKPSGEIEITEVPAADRRAVEALGRVTLVRARVRSGAQRVVTHDGASVSGSFDMPDEPEPEPEVPPRHAEGARDLPLGAPHEEDPSDWEEGDEAVFDLDAPGMPRVDAGAHEAERTGDAQRDAPDDRRIRDTIAPWNEPTPVDGLGTRRHAAAARTATADATSDTRDDPNAIDLAAEAPTSTPTRAASSASSSGAGSLTSSSSGALSSSSSSSSSSSGSLSPSGASSSSGALSSSSGALSSSSSGSAATSSSSGSAATSSPGTSTGRESPARGLSVRTTPAEDLRATPIDPFADGPPLPPARARPADSTSGDRGPRLVPDVAVARRAAAAPASALPDTSPPATRSGTLVAWTLVLSLTAIAVAATLAAARQRGGLSRLLDASAAPAIDEPTPSTPSTERGPQAVVDPAAPPPSECPPTMRRIEGTGVCIDEAEAPGMREIPSNLVSLDDARAACKRRGARLCTAQQWRAACRGPKQWRHPYGARAEQDRCNGAAASGELQDLSRTGAREGCKTPAGVFDLAGNVAEWVEEGAALGGDSSTRAPSCDTRVQPQGGAAAPTIGYRCCLDLAVR
jgi:hypothetical protein